jgi:glycine betaine catabolism B
MIMNKNDNKKSAESWADRLFNQSAATKTAPQGKTYFAHRYHDSHADQGQIPFGDLFADGNKPQPNQSVYPIDLQEKFWKGSDFLDGRPASAEIYPLNGIKSALATDSASCHNSPALSAQFTVLNCYDETLDTKTFRLGRLDGDVFDYLPGQYLTISVVIAGQEYKRSYSLASTPSRSGYLEITVKRDPNGGIVSNWINDHVKVGDSLTIKGPFGKFTCAKDTPQKILFLAAGSGIVPIMSMLRWLADTNIRSDIVLLLSFRSLYDIIYSDELHAIAARHNNISLIITLTQEPLEYSQWYGLTGRIDKKTLVGCVPDVSDRTIYLCGPDAFMAESKQCLLDLAVMPEQIHYESFNVNNPQVRGTEKTQHSITGRPLKHKRGNYRIRFAKSGKTVTTDGDMTILELAESSGIAIDHDCRAGSCGECMVKCLKGNIEMTDAAEIADFDRKRGWVYSCCAYPASNVVLDV